MLTLLTGGIVRINPIGEYKMKNKRLLKLLFLFILTLIIYIIIGKMNNIPLIEQKQTTEIIMEDKIKELEAEFFEFNNPPSPSEDNIYFFYGEVILLEGEMITSIAINDVNYFKFKSKPGEFKVGDEIGMIGKLINFDKTQIVIIKEFGSDTEIQITPVFEPIWFEKYVSEGKGH